MGVKTVTIMTPDEPHLLVFMPHLVPPILTLASYVTGVGLWDMAIAMM